MEKPFTIKSRYNELDCKLKKALDRYANAQESQWGIHAARRDILNIRDEIYRHGYRVGVQAGILVMSELIKEKQDRHMSGFPSYNGHDERGNPT